MRLALISCRVSALFRNGLARATERSGKVLELGQAVAHREHRLSVVYVHSGREFECRQCRGVDVDEAKIKIWMVGHKVAAARNIAFGFSGSWQRWRRAQPRR